MTGATATAPPRTWPPLGGWVLFLCVETVTQVTLKFAGGSLDDRAGFWPMVAHAAANPVTWLGFASYFGGFLVWLTILKDVDLGRAFPMTASMYLLTLTAGVVLFHEHLTPIRLLGVVAIVGGVALLASDENSPKPQSPSSG